MGYPACTQWHSAAKYYFERGRENAVHLAIAALTSALQAAIYLYFQVAAPFLGVRNMRSVIFPVGDAPALPYYLHGLGNTASLALSAVAAALLIALVLWLLRGPRWGQR